VEKLPITILKINKEEEIPYDLLLLADPSMHMINSYLKRSAIYIAKLNGNTIGTFVLLSLSKEAIEIKNIAVDTAYQNKGIGQLLLKYAIEIAKGKGYLSILIGTANSSNQQLYLYQKLGFKLIKTQENFFTENYTPAIFENGLQAQHLLILSKSLQDVN
jgi:ribosomal protein S18 acetylase RimI-like enzyme